MEHIETLAGLEELVGGDAVVVDPREIARSIRDNSWLSPVLTEYVSTRGADADVEGVLAVVRPRDGAQLRETVRYLHARRMPIVARGGGTTNFGQTTPLHGGVVLDMTAIAGDIEVGDGWVEADAGTLQGDLEVAANAEDRELTLLTTTYASSTIGGWVCGGHVGLGTSQFGTIWDGNVTAIELITVEAEPRTVRLVGGEVVDALHAYGTTGLVTRVRMPTVPRRHWQEGLVTFADYGQASAFVREWKERGVPTRVAASQEAPIIGSIAPLLSRLGVEESPGVLIIAEAEGWPEAEMLASKLGGQAHRWPPEDGLKGPSIGLMVYGHRMLWIKRRFADAGFLHIYFEKGRELEQQEALKRLGGDRLLLEFKYMASPWLSTVLGQRASGPLPAAVLTVVNGLADLDFARDACARSGVQYRDPHTFALRDSGIIPHVATLVDAKRAYDPDWLLNPGKLAGADEDELKAGGSA